MSQENRKSRGRPKGTPKTGGRKKGVRNKTNKRLRECFAEAGFDFVDEVLDTLHELRGNPVVKMDVLIKLTPYFMQRLRQEEEAAGGTPEGVEPDDPRLTNEILLKLAGKT